MATAAGLRVIGWREVSEPVTVVVAAEIGTARRPPAARAMTSRTADGTARRARGRLDGTDRPLDVTDADTCMAGLDAKSLAGRNGTSSGCRHGPPATAVQGLVWQTSRVRIPQGPKAGSTTS